jgi:hypothetical protein
MINMSKSIIALFCLGVLCSCGFFERKPLSEEEIRNYIFADDASKEKDIDFYSRGAVGGYSFVARIEVDSGDEAAKMLDGFLLEGRFAENDPNKNLIISLFESSVDQYFSGSSVPSWIPEEAKCNDGVSQYIKKENGLIVYAYQGVGDCDELFFFGTLD